MGRKYSKKRRSSSQTSPEEAIFIIILLVILYIAWTIQKYIKPYYETHIQEVTYFSYIVGILIIL
jgi:hypothetical protein